MKELYLLSLVKDKYRYLSSSQPNPPYPTISETEFSLLLAPLIDYRSEYELMERNGMKILTMHGCDSGCKDAAMLTAQYNTV
jgi:hypothetical protein